jgi:hypothetical protein
MASSGVAGGRMDSFIRNSFGGFMENMPEQGNIPLKTSSAQFFSATSEESNSEIIKLPLLSGMPVDEKCGEKNMSKLPFSAISLGTSSPPAALRSTYSEELPSKPKVNVASPKRDRTCHVELESSKIVPSIAQAASVDSYLKSSKVESSAHFRKMRSVLPRSIKMSPSRLNYLEGIQRRAEQRYEQEDQKLISV